MFRLRLSPPSCSGCCSAGAQAASAEARFPTTALIRRCAAADAFQDQARSKRCLRAEDPAAARFPDRLPPRRPGLGGSGLRSEEHTSELQSLIRISYAVFCLQKKIQHTLQSNNHYIRNHKQTT